MNVIYFGTPDWAIPPLAGLVSKGFQVSMVVTQPDRFTGRKKILTPCAVKSFALQKNLSVFFLYASCNSVVKRKFGELRIVIPFFLIPNL